MKTGKVWECVRFLLSVFTGHWFAVHHSGVGFCLAHGRWAVLSHFSPVTADEEVFPIGGSDGHHFIRVAFEHFLHRLHLFLAAYANFDTGISVRCRQKVWTQHTHSIKKTSDWCFLLRFKWHQALDMLDPCFEDFPIILENKFGFWIWLIISWKCFVQPDI